MKINIVLLCLCSGLFLFSCETVHYFDQQIQNNSSQELAFHFYGSMAESFGDSLTIPAGENKVLYSFQKFGAQPEGLSCLPNLDSLTITSPDGRSLTKEFLIEANWESEVSGKRTVTQTCTFSIEESDLN